MPLAASNVTSRANSDLISIAMVSERTSLSAPERMELILRIAQGYDAATSGSTERFRAQRILPRHYDNGTPRPRIDDDGVVRGRTKNGDPWAMRLSPSEATSAPLTPERRPQDPQVHPHILATGGRPDSVTHFICPEGVEITGDPEECHHIDYLGRCAHCRKDQGELRKDLGL